MDWLAGEELPPKEMERLIVSTRKIPHQRFVWRCPCAAKASSLLGASTSTSTLGSNSGQEKGGHLSMRLLQIRFIYLFILELGQLVDAVAERIRMTC